MEIDKQPFGKTENGAPVDLFTLTNNHGIETKAKNSAENSHGMCNVHYQVILRVVGSV